MGFRTGVEAVKEVITAADHDELDNKINLTAFIRTANRLVNKIATRDTEGLLDREDLKEIETYLAAHFYTFRDQQYQSTSSDNSSDTYQGKTGMYFDSSFYGQAAKVLDVTGYLAFLQNQAEKGGKEVVSFEWLGKTDTEKTEYEDW